MKIIFDGTWISINGQTVPFYVSESTEKYTKGKIPAYLNDELVNIVAVWDEQNINGKILGAEYIDEYGDTTISAKGLQEIKNGDKIEFLQVAKQNLYLK